MAHDPATFVGEELWLAIAVVTFFLAGAVSLIGLEILAGPIAFVGWFLLTPVFLFWGDYIAEYLYGDEETDHGARTARDDAETAEEDAFERLKNRYAAGEITESEFEHRLERLLEADERATGWEGHIHRSGTDPNEHGRDSEQAADRDRDLDRR